MNSRTADIIQWTSVSASPVQPPGEYLVLVKVGYGIALGKATYNRGEWHAGRHKGSAVISYAPVPVSPVTIGCCETSFVYRDAFGQPQPLRAVRYERVNHV